MVCDYRNALHFLMRNHSPLLSCCIDDGEYGLGWYVDATDSLNRNAINIGFFKQKAVATAFCESMKRRFL